MGKPHLTHSDGDTYEWGWDQYNYRCNVSRIDGEYVCTATMYHGETSTVRSTLEDGKFQTLALALRAGFCSLSPYYNRLLPSEVYRGMASVWADQNGFVPDELSKLPLAFAPHDENRMDDYIAAVRAFRLDPPVKLPEMEF